jgi:hypothetical protein
MSTSSVTVTVPGSDTQVLYNNGGAFGAASGLVYSGSNVGVGTTSPSQKLDVLSGINVQAADNSDLPFINFSNNGAVYNWGRVGGLLEGSGDGTLYFQTKTGGGLTEKMRITSAGNVGIGTDSPIGKLDISTTSGDTIFRTIVARGGTATSNDLAIKQDFITGVAANYLWSNSNYMLGVGRNGGTMPSSESDATDLSYLVINSSGNVGIGTVSPGAKLNVSGSGFIVKAQAGGSDSAYLQAVNGSYDYIAGIATSLGLGWMGMNSNHSLAIITNGSERVRIAAGGNVGIGTTSPNAKLDVSGSVLISGSLTVSGSSTFTNIGPAVFTGSITQNASTASFGGVVGIGTTTPDGNLNIYGTGDQLIKVENVGTYLMRFGLVSNEGFIGSSNATPINFTTNGSNRMYIATGGNVGIGTTSPSYRLHVKSTGINSIPFAVQRAANTNNIFYVYEDSNGNGNLTVENSGGTVGVFLNSSGSSYFNGGNVGIGTINPTGKLTISQNNSGGVAALTFTEDESTIQGSSANTKILMGGNLSLNAASTWIAGTNGSERMRITSAGVVGIGTTNPSGLFEVKGDGVSYFTRGTKSILLNPNVVGQDTNALIDTSTGMALAFGTAGSEHMRIASGGNVGIGTATPSNKLQVAGGITATSFTGSFSGSVSAPGSTTQIVYNNGGALSADSGLVYSGSNVGIGTTSPSSALTINGTTPYIRLERSGVPTWEIRQNFPSTEYGFQIVNVTSGSIPFFVGNSNNVGIGTTSPSSKLQVDGTLTITNGGINIPADTPIRKAGDNSIILYSTTLPGISIGSGTITDMVSFNAGGTERVRINTSGSMGIGNTSPTQKLDVTGYIRATSGFVGNSGLSLWGDNSSGAAGLFVTTAGNVGIGTTSPSNLLHLIGSAGGGDAANLRIDSTNEYGGLVINENTTFRTFLGYGNSGNIFSNAQTDSTALRAANYLHLGASSVATITIDNSDRVGIGTTSPASKLHVSGASATIRVDDTAAGNPGFEIMSGGSTQASLISNTSTGNTTLLVPAGSLTLRAAVGNVFITGSTFQTGSGTITGDLTVGGTITAQKLNVQQITSSVIYSSGSNVFGNSLANTQTFTGSLQVTGSTHYFLGNVGIGTTSPISGQGTPLTLASSTGYVGLTLSGSGAYSHLWQLYASGDGGSNKFFGIYDSTNAIYRLVTTSAGNVGIGTTSPSNKLYVSATVEDYVAVIENLGTGTAKNGLWIKSDSSFTNATVLKVTGTTSDSETLQVNPGQVRIGPGNIGQFDGVFYVTSSAATIANFVANNSSALFISGSGNVGIGTTNPAAKFQVSGGDGIINNAFIGEVPTYTSANAQFSHTSRAVANEYSFLSANDGETFINSKTGYNIRFRVNNNDKVIINSAGNVGIGTTSPNAKLQVIGPSLTVADENTYGLWISETGDDTKAIILGYDQGIDAGIITAVDKATTWKNLVLQPNGSNVGIGTTNPTTKLEVAGTVLTTSTLGSTAGSYAIDHPGINTWKIGVTATNSSTFHIGNDTGGSFVNKIFNITAAGNVGINTTSPGQKLQIDSPLQTEYYGTDNASPADTMNLVGTGAYRGLGTGSALLFSVPANTDGSNIWAQARILGTGDNGGNGSAEGAMFLQTRALYNPGVGGSWNWRTNMVLRASGNVGIGTTSPTNKLEVAGGVTATSFTGSFSGSVSAPGSTTQVVFNSGGALAASSNFVFSGSNVGIGTTSPYAPLHVKVTGTPPTSGQQNYFGNVVLQGDSGYYNRLRFDTNGTGSWGVAVNPDRKFVISRLDSGFVGTPDDSNFVIDTSGSVGIGTTSPTQLLHIVGTNAANNGLTLQNTNASGNSQLRYLNTSGTEVAAITYINGTTSTVYHYTAAGGNLLNLVGANVGIGTTSPAFKLDVNGDSATRGTEYILQSVNNTTGYLYFDHSGTQVWKQGIFNDNTSTFSIGNGGGFDRLFNITNAGNVGIGTTAPVSILNTSGSNQGITHRDASTGKGYMRFLNGSTQVSLFGVAGAWEGSSLQDTMIAAETGYNIRFYTDGSATPKMYISGSGNVGIGTTSPANKLTIQSNSTQLRLETASDPSAYHTLIESNYNSNNPLNIYSSAAASNAMGTIVLSGITGVNTYLNSYYGIVFGTSTSSITASTVRMMITNGGNVGIGTTTPSQRLHVSGAIAIEAESTTTKYSTTFSGSLTTNTNIAFIPTGSFKAAFFDYYVASGSVNMRAGTIMAVQNNSTSRYTDTSTGDIGNTSAVDFSTSVVSGNLVLTANISSGTWEIKTAYRAL